MIQTPQYLQKKGIPAKFDRQLLEEFFSPGVASASAMVVTSTGGARSVTISKGACYVPGSQNTDQGTYRVFNDNALARTHDPAVTFPRLDQLVVRVYDSTELGSGALDYGDIEIVKGTEANGATAIGRQGAVPDSGLPANTVRIADVLVPIGASPVIPSANIIDRRPLAGLKMGGAAPIGSCIPYCMANEPTDGRWSLADGGLIDRTVYSAFFAGAGNAYNGGVDPGSNKVRKPDKRGRGSVGADSMGTSAASGGPTGNAGRLTTLVGHLNARGQNGGAERYALATTEIPAHAHLDNYNALMGFPPGDHYAFAQSSGPADFYLSHNQTGGQPAGGGLPHENMSPYEVDLWIVRIA